MKDIELVVVKNDDERLVYDAFNKYFECQDLKTLLNLVCRSLAYGLVDAQIDSLYLGIEKIMPQGLYLNGKITLNSELFKKPRVIGNLPLILDCLFHELTHAVLHENNIKILTTKQNVRKFLPIYDVGRLTKIFNTMCGDYEFACASSMYFYRKNKNEYLARKNAYDMTSIYLQKYANGYPFKMVSFEEKENRFINLLYKDFPCIRYNEGVATDLLCGFQNKVICGGIDYATEDDLKSLVASINVMLAAENRYNLINECAKSTNIQRVNMLLSTPLIEIDQREREILSRNHDERVLDQILFYRNDIQRTC